MLFLISQLIGVVTGIVAVVTMQFKDMRKILVGQIASNVLSSSTYFLLGGFSGAGVCFVAIFQSIVMYALNKREITPPKSVIAVFIALYLGCSAISFKP